MQITRRSFLQAADAAPALAILSVASGESGSKARPTETGAGAFLTVDWARQEG